MKVIELLMDKFRGVLASIKAVIAEPNVKQREAYGRVAHNLAVACMIGAVSLGYSTPPAGETYLWRIIELSCIAAVALVLGGFLSKGE